MAKYLRRRGLLEEADDEAPNGIAASVRSLPAGPEWRRGVLPRTGAPLSFDEPPCVALDAHRAILRYPRLAPRMTCMLTATTNSGDTGPPNLAMPIPHGPCPARTSAFPLPRIGLVQG